MPDSAVTAVPDSEAGASVAQADTQTQFANDLTSHGTLARLPLAGGLSLLTALLLVVSFPDFNFSPLAWIGFVPLLVTLARGQTPRRAFLLGWLFGSVFFYATCHWLSYSMIHYGGIHPLIAYSLLIPGALVLGLFPAAFAWVLIRGVRHWGPVALLLAPVLWIAFEWARLSVTGQLWNAIGYSQAFHPQLIQVARFGGVYAVSFLIILVNSAVAYAIVRLTKEALAVAIMIIVLVAAVVFVSTWIASPPAQQASQPTLSVIALQPNVPMDPLKSTTQIHELVQHHLVTSEQALKSAPGETHRLLIWPESPMNFSYAMDSQFRDLIGRFAQQQRTFILFNSQEPAPDKGTYNSAVLINEEGRLIAQYDKIRLMPFGEYVPLPQWIPGSNQVRGIVGEFTPGTRYTLMPVAGVEAGVFICIESAYPWIARNFATQGADLLVNISNDGYLGQTAVMRQHLANAVFRAVENGRPLLRVTNTGITAYVTSNGEVRDAAPGFETAVRTWTVTNSPKTQTFYTRHGDLFVVSCAVLTLLVAALTFIRPLRQGKTARLQA